MTDTSDALARLSELVNSREWKDTIKSAKDEQRDHTAFRRRRGNGWGPRLLAAEWGPERILAQGELYGYRWFVWGSGMGFRNGYVEIPHNHPWTKNRRAREYARIYVRAHGGITLMVPSEKQHNKKTRWWFGFDTGHAGDAADPTLFDDETRISDELLKAHGSRGWFPESDEFLGGKIRTTEYVIGWCEKICVQANNAKKQLGRHL